uniref:Tetratricopeptide repeat protein n=1 Tax=Acrobeloides nanus TaxID=290746 RepID=A0A914DZT2_9BILA
MIYLKLNESYFAYIDASEAIKFDPTFIKAHYRQGKALAELGFYSKSAEKFYYCLELIRDKKISCELDEIKDKPDDPKIDPGMLENYDPLESDSQRFSREFFLGDLNRFILNGEQFVEEKDHYPYDLKVWKSGEELIEFFFQRACEEHAVKNYDKALYYLDFARALDCEPRNKLTAPLSKAGFSQFQADCCLKSGRHLQAIDHALYAIEIYKEACDGWKSFPELEPMRWYSICVSYVIVSCAAVKGGCYRLARKQILFLEDLINDLEEDEKFSQERFDKLLEILKQLKEEISDKKADNCIDERIYAYLEPLHCDTDEPTKDTTIHGGFINELMAPIEKAMDRFMVDIPGYTPKGKFRIDDIQEKTLLKPNEKSPFLDENVFGRLAHKLYPSGRQAWENVFPDLRIAQTVFEELEKSGEY